MMVPKAHLVEVLSPERFFFADHKLVEALQRSPTLDLCAGQATRTVRAKAMHYVLYRGNSGLGSAHRCYPRPVERHHED